MNQNMFVYPLLTSEEQFALPALQSAPTTMQSKFDDSTHQLWHCETDNGPMVIKVCNHEVLAQSTFWQGANALFGADFPKSLGQIEETHKLISKKGVFAIPDFVSSKANRFVITRYLSGHDLDVTLVTDDMVVQLATHISQLHQQKYKKWGYINAPTYPANAWGSQLQQALLLMAEQSTVAISKPFLHDMVEQAGKIEDTAFVPIMLDLRWDQFRLLGQGQISELALIDLDAFVIGPSSLELVLLEYLLTVEQFAIFKSQYIKHHAWPNYDKQKPCYQLLLFLMNVLGERDLDRWMGQY